jgi:hypothetical protein
MPLNEILSDWETFFLLAGTSAATLIGLLFIAISIHLNVFHQQTSLHLHHYAALTFNCFFYVLLIAMLFLVPGLTSGWLGVPLLILGLLGSGNTIRQRMRASNEPAIAGKFNIPIAALLGLTIIAILMLLQIYQSLYGLVLVILLFLISASLNAWTLLIYTQDQSLP